MLELAACGCEFGTRLLQLDLAVGQCTPEFVAFLETRSGEFFQRLDLGFGPDAGSAQVGYEGVFAFCVGPHSFQLVLAVMDVSLEFSGFEESEERHASARGQDQRLLEIG